MFGIGGVARAQDLPRFELRNWDGTVVSNSSLLGSTTIVAVTYAKCIFACPMLTFQLVELDRALGSPEDLRYLHVSVNPQDDTAEEILLHFERHDIDPRQDPRWLFVNGPEGDLSRLLEELEIEVEKRPVEGGFLIEHTILVLVVGPDGNTLRSLDTYSWERKEMLDVLETSAELG